MPTGGWAEIHVVATKGESFDGRPGIGCGVDSLGCTCFRLDSPEDSGGSIGLVLIRGLGVLGWFGVGVGIGYWG